MGKKLHPDVKIKYTGVNPKGGGKPTCKGSGKANNPKGNKGQPLD